MAESKNSYFESFKIRSSEVDPSGRMRLPAVCDLLQEVAETNALELNFDISQLNNQHLTWVLHRLQVQMKKLPSWRDTITIKTWPSGGNGLRAYRDFLIFAADGNEIGRSLSYWLMVDLKSKRPVRIPQEILDTASDDETHLLPVSDSRLTINGEIAVSKTFNVRQGDLDLNHHVNNVKYIDWALEVASTDKAIKAIDIEFRNECKYGDAIEAGIAQKKAPQTFIGLRRKKDQQIIAVARLS